VKITANSKLWRPRNGDISNRDLSFVWSHGISEGKQSAQWEYDVLGVVISKSHPGFDWRLFVGCWTHRDCTPQASLRQRSVAYGKTESLCRRVGMIFTASGNNCLSNLAVYFNSAEWNTPHKRQLKTTINQHICCCSTHFTLTL
jgi:hypothetical protein